MLQFKKPINRPKPLGDPLLYVTLGGVALAAANAIFIFYAKSSLYSLFSVAFGLGFVLLTAPWRKPNAIYLRAFKTDSSTTGLRHQLIAILGPRFRLAGIRPPREHSTQFLRFVFPAFFALKYAGSKYMELEAGDDWMQRLWATYHQTRIAFLDIRETTPYVHQEIQMTLLTLGRQRCIFLVDHEMHPDSEWRHTLSEILGPEVDVQSLQLLDACKEQQASGAMRSALKEIVAHLPDSISPDSDDGWQFTLDHSKPELLQAALQQQSPSIVLTILKYAIFVGALLLGVHYFVASLEEGGAAGVLLAVTAVPFEVVLVGIFLFYFLNAVLGSVRSVWLLARAGHALASLVSFAVLIAAVMLLASPPVLTILWQKAEAQTQREVQESSQQDNQNFQELKTDPSKRPPAGLHNTRLQMDYPLPNTFLNVKDQSQETLREAFKDGMEYLPVADLKFADCGHLELGTVSPFTSEIRSLYIFSFAGNCSGEAVSLASLEPIARTLVAKHQGAVLTSPLKPYELAGHPAVLLGGTWDKYPMYGAVSCIATGANIVCWSFESSSCSDVQDMQSYPVTFNSYPQAPVVPLKLTINCAEAETAVDH